MKAKIIISFLSLLFSFPAFSQHKTTTPKTKKEIIAEVEKLTDDYVLFIDSIVTFLQDTKIRDPESGGGFVTPITRNGKYVIQDYSFQYDKGAIIQCKTQNLIKAFLHIDPDTFSDGYYRRYIKDFTKDTLINKYGNYYWKDHHTLQTMEEIFEYLWSMKSNCEGVERYLIEKITAEDWEFNKVALLIPNKRYIVEGEDYVLTIYMLEHFEKDTPVVSINGETLNYYNGKWTYSMNYVLGEGDSTLVCTIKMKNKEGIYITVSKTEELQVMKSQFLVSADENFNVLYTDYDNYIYCSIDGFYSSDMDITASGCELKKERNGKYIVRVPKGFKEVYITGSIKGKMMGRWIYRVLELPHLVGVLYTHTFTNGKGTLDRKELNQIDSIYVRWPDPLYPRPYKYPHTYSVCSYTCNITHQEKSKQYHIIGGAISPDLKKEITKCYVGDLVIFTDIKSIDESGQISDKVDPLVYTIK